MSWVSNLWNCLHCCVVFKVLLWICIYAQELKIGVYKWRKCSCFPSWAFHVRPSSQQAQWEAPEAGAAGTAGNAGEEELEQIIYSLLHEALLPVTFFESESHGQFSLEFSPKICLFLGFRTLLLVVCWLVLSMISSRVFCVSRRCWVILWCSVVAEVSGSTDCQHPMHTLSSVHGAGSQCILNLYF